jgi:hypothetical protein
MRDEELSGIVGLFVPNSPSCELSVVCNLMNALVAGAGFEPATFGL